MLTHKMLHALMQKPTGQAQVTAGRPVLGQVLLESTDRGLILLNRCHTCNGGHKNIYLNNTYSNYQLADKLQQDLLKGVI